MKLLSLAKLNLYLEIIGKEPDGYHQIESIMQTISLSDKVEVEPSDIPGIFVSSNISSLPVDERNLAYKAAKLFIEKFGWVSKGVRIILEKNIPLASGMGGGSSNAATVLIAMALMCGVDILNSILLEIASRIGCDVPFFLYGGTAIAKGKGTEITPLPPLKGIPVLVVVPDVEISTHWAYKNIVLPLYPFKIPSILLNMLSKNSSIDIQELNRLLFNRFASLVFKIPKVKEVKEILESLGIENISLSGSGPTLFSIQEDKEKCDLFAKILRERFNLRAFSVEFVGRLSGV
jgi:4-diphosphocytidyl-2-C-methyl-D-erythritol kinase